MKYRHWPVWVLLAALLVMTGLGGQTFRDEETGVTVTGDFAAGTAVAVTALEESDPDHVLCKNRIYDLCKRFKAYRLELTAAHAASSESGSGGASDAMLTVRIPVPESYKGQELAVYHVDPSGSYTVYNGLETEEGFSFRTDRLGIFALGVPRTSGRLGSFNQVEQLLLMVTVVLLLFVNGILLRRLKNKK